jgi:outer membrane protein assembly factor BamB
LLLKRLSIARPSDPPTAFFIRRIDARYAIVGSWLFSGPRRAVVVALPSGTEVAHVEDSVAAVVERPDGTPDGLVAIDRGLRYLDLAGKVSWSTPTTSGDSAAAVSVDGKLIVATFSPLASGVQLEAFDRTTGKKVWTGDVELRPVAHSAYANRVTLEHRAGVLLLRGDESAWSYLQLFEPATGKRLFSDAATRW